MVDGDACIGIACVLRSRASGRFEEQGERERAGFVFFGGSTFVFLCCMHPRFCLLRIVRAEEAEMRAGEEVQVAPVRVCVCVCECKWVCAVRDGVIPASQELKSGETVQTG